MFTAQMDGLWERMTTSARIERIKADVMERQGSFPTAINPFVRSIALWRALDKGGSRVQVRASYLHELVKLAPIKIEADWNLAGEHLPTERTAFTIPEGSNPEHVEFLRQLGVKPETINNIQASVSRWQEANCLSVGDVSPENQKGKGAWGQASSGTVYWASGWIENHSIRDYAKAINIGFRGLREQVEKRLHETDIAAPDFPRKENFWLAALQICDAGILLGRRYAEMATDMAQLAATADERARLLQMADLCARVPAKGARTFLEAVQSLWFSHVLSCGEDGINANSLGRLDQILYPYYQEDVRAGRLNREAAVEIMEELACKLYLEYDVQAITLGGLDPDGADAVNELSYIILEATRNVEFVRDVSVRLSSQTPSAFIDLASELIARGGGIPFLFNDDCFVPALTSHGIRIEDARDYAPIGCIELTIPGKANPHAVSGWFNSLKCLELALFDGLDPLSGEQLGPRTGTLAEFASFDAFFDAYRAQVDFFVKRMVYNCNRGELMQRELGPLPCWSLLTDECIERGRDITDGGAVYNYHSICFLGTANTADALMALKKLIFDERVLSPSELLEALRSNFDGHESQRQLLLNRAPKYGNDNEEVDALARRVAEHFIGVMDGIRSPLGGRYFVHLFSFKCNIEFGKTVGSTPDGRLCAEPLAYSLSAHQGRDVSGVTALLSSLARLPHDRAAGASAAIVEIDPALVEGEAGTQRLSQLIQAALRMGVGQLQWNVVTAERLRLAQQEPEKYGNIAVRVAGYSQQFKLIGKELQEHIIARTKHSR